MALQDDDTMRAFRDYLESELLVRIAEFLGGPDATERATAAVGVIGGLIFTRYLNPIRAIAALPAGRSAARLRPGAAGRPARSSPPALSPVSPGERMRPRLAQPHLRDQPVGPELVPRWCQLVHPGDRRHPGAAATAAGPARPDRVLADKAYTSRANRRYLRRRGIKATIPSKADQDANRRKLGSKGGRPRPSTPSYNSVTPWNAASTGSNATAQ